MPRVKNFVCEVCRETDQDKLIKGRHRCFACQEIMDSARYAGLLDTIPAPKYIVREQRILNGQPRRRDHPSYRCVADPQRGFLGSYFYSKIMELNIDEGVLPSGSLWINDHDSRVYEVLGILGEPQDLLPVGSQRLKLLKIRFPRLGRALCNPGVY